MGMATFRALLSAAKADIVEVAKCFTGWTIADPRGYRKAAANTINGTEDKRIDRLQRPSRPHLPQPDRDCFGLQRQLLNRLELDRELNGTCPRGGDSDIRHRLLGVKMGEEAVIRDGAKRSFHGKSAETGQQEADRKVSSQNVHGYFFIIWPE